MYSGRGVVGAANVVDRACKVKFGWPITWRFVVRAVAGALAGADRAIFAANDVQQLGGGSGGGGALEGDLAVLHQHDPVADFERLRVIVCNHYDGYIAARLQ